MNKKCIPNLSIIVPFYNEEKSIEILYASLKNTMERLDQSYEIIFVNDGSSDMTLNALNNLVLKTKDLIVCTLPQHMGKSIALQKGFDIAKGELIITLDGDLQDVPEEIPKLLHEMQKGYDMVCGWRHKRKDSFMKIFVSGIANALRRVISGENIHDVGCSLRVFKRGILKDIHLSGGMHRLFTLIVKRAGYKIGEVKINHCHRKFGRSKYNFTGRLFEGIIDFAYIYFSGAERRRQSKRL